MRNFLRTSEWSRAELDQMIDAAGRFKRQDDQTRPLTGKSVALVFFNPSLRTRASMQVGLYELGGNAVALEPGGTSWTLEHREGVVMDGDKTEHVAEFVRVLGRYCAAIGSGLGCQAQLSSTRFGSAPNRSRIVIMSAMA